MAKRRARVKFTIWLLTTKSQESTRFPYVQVSCDIQFESSRRELQLCFKLHLNRRSACKVMGPQSWKNPNCENFGTPTWESRDKMTFGVLVSWLHTEYIIRGKVVASPKFGLWWVLWIQVYSWLVLTPKVFQLCTNQLVVWFCAGPCEWVITCHFS